MDSRKERGVLAAGSLEVMEDFALPLQNRALAMLLGVPQDEAELWTSWGVHVFHEGADGTHKGAELEAYLNRKFDESVFDCPEKVRLDRKPNPHLAFGFGPHVCLGVHHARLLVRTLLATVAERIARIDIRDAHPNIETCADWQRMAGYEKLDVTLTAR